MVKIETKIVKTAHIKLNPDNPRRIGNVEMERLVKSLQEFPEMMKLREIVVDEGMVVLGGNMRLLALRKIGAKECTAKVVKGLTPEQKREFVIKDNAAFGEWNFDDLANSWSDLPLAEWGVDLPEDWLCGDKTEPADAEPQIDRAEELNKTWGVKPGDLWQIGEHRLLCGDSTKKEDVGRVMGEIKADMCFTSPPYNMGISSQLSGNTHVGDNLYKNEYNDNQSQYEYLKLLTCFTDLALDVCKYVFVNIQILSGNKIAFLDYWHGYKNKFADVAIWDKKHAAPAAALRVMDSRFEFILIFGGNASRAIGTREFRGMVHNVYEGNPQRQNKNADIHAATMPLDLPNYYIETFTNANEFIYEPFTGSGTTMVACQNLNRKCRGIEISENYCAVILQRMTDAFPGIEIKKI